MVRTAVFHSAFLYFGGLSVFYSTLGTEYFERPPLKVQIRYAATTGYRGQEISPLTPRPTGGDLTRERISYLFNIAKQYGFFISPEDSFDIDLPWMRHLLLAMACAEVSAGDVIPPRRVAVHMLQARRYDYQRGRHGLSAQLCSQYLRSGNAGLTSLEYRFPPAWTSEWVRSIRPSFLGASPERSSQRQGILGIMLSASETSNVPLQNLPYHYYSCLQGGSS
jgi:hypothetical protein